MTKIAQHTPGPWALDENRRGSHVDINSKAHGALARVVWQMADDYRLGRPSPECEANARLIAAAPELLEALKPFAKAHKAWSGGNAREHFSLAVTPADFLRALEAVAKVELAA